MQILIIIVIVLFFLGKVDTLQILLQSPQEICFAITSQKEDQINLHIYSHDKNNYKKFQYFVIDPDAKTVLKRSNLKTDKAIVTNQLKAKKDGRYQLCVRQIDHIERFVDIAFACSSPISNDVEEVVDNRPLDDANFKGVLIDFEKDYEKGQELIDDLDITKNNHLELVRFMDNQIEIIKEYQYAKVYLVFGIVVVQIILFSFILKNKEQMSIV